MTKKFVKCGCKVSECNCQNSVEVPEYVPDGTPVICDECQLEHAPEAVESTGI